MKEASGEANLTVVAIILIGVIAAVVTPLITTTMNKTKERTDCLNNGGNWIPGKDGGSCDYTGAAGTNNSSK